MTPQAGMALFDLAVSFAWAILWVWLANRMAVRRIRSARVWVWLAAFFGPFALLVLKFLPAKAPLA